MDKLRDILKHWIWKDIFCFIAQVIKVAKSSQKLETCGVAQLIGFGCSCKTIVLESIKSVE
eukprot:scaffold143621_cov36-Cyclotella_meneghiniana.AAC.3